MSSILAPNLAGGSWRPRATLATALSDEAPSPAPGAALPTTTAAPAPRRIPTPEAAPESPNAEARVSFFFFSPLLFL
ncbi:hypothetical protein M5K25_013870 [Dendrobium thyrsiflorum]|uniref:Uncharacterized protein n=1 Tax=Dendrobium thyrsiflorum TaxID=117978 RepID=A0ABD0UUF8_DENTH